MGQAKSIEYIGTVDAIRGQIDNFKSQVPKPVFTLAEQYLEKDNPCQLWSDDGRLCLPFHYPYFKNANKDLKECGFFCEKLCQNKFQAMFEHASTTGHDWPFFVVIDHPDITEPIELSITRMIVTTTNPQLYPIYFAINYQNNADNYYLVLDATRPIQPFFNFCNDFYKSKDIEIVFNVDVSSLNQKTIQKFSNNQGKVVGFADTRLTNKRWLQNFFPKYAIMTIHFSNDNTIDVSIKQRDAF